MSLKTTATHSSSGLGVALARGISIFCWLAAVRSIVVACGALGSGVDIRVTIQIVGIPVGIAVGTAFVGLWVWANAPRFGRSLAGAYEDDDDDRVVLSGALVLEGIVGSFGVLRLASSIGFFLPLLLQSLSGPDAGAKPTSRYDVYDSLIDLALGIAMLGWAVWSAKKTDGDGGPVPE